MFWHWLLPHKMPPKDTVDSLGGALTDKNTGVVSKASRGSRASEQPMDREEVNQPGSLPSLDSQWSALTPWLSECVIWPLWWSHVMPDSKPCVVQFRPTTKAEGHPLHDWELGWGNWSPGTGAQSSPVTLMVLQGECGWYLLSFECHFNRISFSPCQLVTHNTVTYHKNIYLGFFPVLGIKLLEPLEFPKC